MTDVPESDTPAGDGKSPLSSTPSSPSLKRLDEMSEPVASNRNKRKVSRWERPPEPRDWRWVVGHFGRALITLGLLMFGFVAYQLWGTGIETLRAQSKLESDFNSQLEAKGITAATLGPTTSASTATTATAATSTTTATTAGTTVGTTVGTTAGTGAAATAATSTSTSTTSTTSLAPEPVPQNYGAIQPGDVLARLKIPKIGLDFYVVAGVNVKDLRKGVGHFPNTPLPGQLGNSALAGHRTSHLQPFYSLDELKPGDEIQVFTKLGDGYAYIVTDSLVVNPSDYYVITDSDPKVATLTLITCTPLGTSSHRLVVHATLDPTRSSAIGMPVINYGQPDPIPADTALPGDDTVPTDTVPTDTVPTENAPPSSVALDPATGPAATTGAVVTASTSQVAPGASTASTRSSGFTGDAFSQGWFADSGAWPHVIGWGVAFGLLWYGLFRLAKRFRRLWLMLVVGFVPMLVVLFFFYENVNRLLPAAI